MAAVPRYISPYNVAIPQATGQVIQYIRNADTFRLNKYVQLVESPGITGIYYVIDQDTPARVVEDATFAWKDGADRPTGQWNQLNFTTQGFQTQRRCIPWTLGEQAIEMAKDFWDVMASETASSSQQAMTLRTYRLLTLAQNPAVWGNNTADAGTLNGLGATGTWDKASDDPADTGSYNAIKKSLLAALTYIVLQTNASVRVDDLRLIVSPELAELMACSAEISNYVKFGPYSKGNLEGSDEKFIERWGLPAPLRHRGRGRRLRPRHRPSRRWQGHAGTSDDQPRLRQEHQHRHPRQPAGRPGRRARVEVVLDLPNLLVQEPHERRGVLGCEE